MDIIIRSTDNRPIYEQIAAQIKTLILAGRLSPGEVLPSMRVLAKELRISVITTKRAYEELERAGFIITQAGRGSFVAARSPELLREEQLHTVETHLQHAVQAARLAGLRTEEFLEMARTIFQGE